MYPTTVPTGEFSGISKSVALKSKGSGSTIGRVLSFTSNTVTVNCFTKVRFPSLPNIVSGKLALLS